jgi:hypothetical protein
MAAADLSQTREFFRKPGLRLLNMNRDRLGNHLRQGNIVLRERKPLLDRANGIIHFHVDPLCLELIAHLGYDLILAVKLREG